MLAVGARSVREFGESAGESLAYAFGLPFALYAFGNHLRFSRGVVQQVCISNTHA